MVLYSLHTCQKYAIAGLMILYVRVGGCREMFVILEKVLCWNLLQLCAAATPHGRKWVI